MKVEAIKKILVLGSGAMGRQIALQFAIHGYQVNLHDLSDTILDEAVLKIGDMAREEGWREKIGARRLEDILKRIVPFCRPEEAAEGVDLLSESVPEDPLLKAKVFSKFNKLCPPRTIFTTNSSTLVPSMFAAATGRPALFAAFHFYGPGWGGDLVEIMPHPGTDPETVNLLREVAVSISQTPILMKKENSGYVFNAMLTALTGEAMNMVTNGVAEVEDVDRIWMGLTKMEIGPFGILDLIGLETSWKITAFWAKTMKNQQALKNAELLKQYINQGRLGVQVGQGFYSYPDPTYKKAGFRQDDK